jgi:hypothetical protein
MSIWSISLSKPGAKNISETKCRSSKVVFKQFIFRQITGWQLFF